MKNEKEVFFDVYCPSCKHKDEPETEKPCDECLGHPVNENSHKPYLYDMNLISTKRRRKDD